MSARDEILARIRGAIGPSPAVPPIPREYETGGRHLPGNAELLRLLTERLEDYKATVRRCAATDLDATLADVTAGWRVVVPAGSAISVPGAVRDDPVLTHAQLDGVDAAL